MMMSDRDVSRIALHFTNSKTRWGGVAPFKSTGFVESITRDGARQFLNVGIGGDYIRLKCLFQHHGFRCNKLRVNGNESIPAVLIFDIGGLSGQQGYDHPLAWQVNEVISVDRLLGHFEFTVDTTDEEFECMVLEIIKEGA